jgi:hypothetical protein
MGGAVLALLVGGAAPAQGAAAVRVVAHGLDNPRGLEFGPDGGLFVAEAGRGGASCLGANGPCVGLTAAITRIRHGVQRRVVTGLLSVAEKDGSFAIGTDDVSLARRSGMFTLATSLGEQSPPGVPRRARRQSGNLLRVSPTAKHVIADIDDFEFRHNPDG